MAHAASAVGEEAQSRISPTEPVAPLMFATITAVWAAVFSCHALAIRAGSPLLALLPPLALVAFADSVLDDLIKPIYGVLFLAAALAIVFADSVRRVQGWGPVWSGPGRRSTFLAVTGRGARRIGLLTVAVAVAAPFVVPGFGSKAVIDISSADEGDINISPLVSVASSLRSGEPKDLFLVDSDQKAYWRLTALEIFNGISWQMDEGVPAEPAPANTQLGPGGGTGTMTTTFTAVNDLSQFDWLPVPAPASGLTLDRDVSWNDQTGTAIVPDGLQEGDVYTVTSTFPQPTAEELADATFSPPAPELIALPDETKGELEEIAQDWTAGTTNVFDQAWAIQQRLRSVEFDYDESVSPREDAGSLLDFLQVSKAGFCQQFATAMAALLRSLGIPARVAVGFTLGDAVARDDADPDETGSAQYLVTTKQLHAWVEVPFPNVGWVGFDPTPGRGNPNFPSPELALGPGGPPEPCDRFLPRGGGFADPRGGCATRSTPTSTGGDASPVTIPTIAPAVGGGSRGTRLSPVLLVAGAIALLLLLGLAAVPAVRASRRRRLLHRAAGEPRRLILATYDVLLERAAELGLPRETGETPAEYLTKVTASGRLEDGHLERLTATTVRAAYAPGEPTTDEALDASADANEVLDELRRTSTLRDRLLGPFVRRLR
jgi:hypothetical protein